MSLGIEIYGKFVIAEEVPVEKVNGIIIPNLKPEPFLIVVAGSIDAGRKIIVNNDWNKKFIYKNKEYCIVALENIVGILPDEKS